MTDQPDPNKTATDKIETAVALQYKGKSAPKITAKGDDETAQRIVNIAEEYGIPLYHDASLARSLSKLDLGSEIPEQLYRTIAEIIAFAYGLQDKVPDEYNSPQGHD